MAEKQKFEDKEQERYEKRYPKDQILLFFFFPFEFSQNEKLVVYAGLCHIVGIRNPPKSIFAVLYSLVIFSQRAVEPNM